MNFKQIVNVKAAVRAKPEWLCPCNAPILSTGAASEEGTVCQGAPARIYLLDKRSCWRKQPWSHVQLRGRYWEWNARRKEGFEDSTERRQPDPPCRAVKRGVCLLQPLSAMGGFVFPAAPIKDLLPFPTALFNPSLWLVHAATLSWRAENPLWQSGNWHGHRLAPGRVGRSFTPP